MFGAWECWDMRDTWSTISSRSHKMVTPVRPLPAFIWEIREFVIAPPSHQTMTWLQLPSSLKFSIAPKGLGWIFKPTPSSVHLQHQLYQVFLGEKHPQIAGPLHVDTYHVGPMEVDHQPFAMIRAAQPHSNGRDGWSMVQICHHHHQNWQKYGGSGSGVTFFCPFGFCWPSPCCWSLRLRRCRVKSLHPSPLKAGAAGPRALPHCSCVISMLYLWLSM